LLKKSLLISVSEISKPNQAAEDSLIVSLHTTGSLQTTSIMEAGGPILRAVLRQISTANAIRNLPSPCRARWRGQEPRTPPLGVFLLREAVSTWGEADAGLEVWDLDDGFQLPPPLLDMGSSVRSTQSHGNVDFGMELDLPSPEGGPSPEEPQSGEQPLGNEILQQILMERLGSPPPALLPLAAAIQAAVLAGGRRFPRPRPGPRGPAVKPGGGRWMRFRQQRRGPTTRQGQIAPRAGSGGGPTARNR